MKRKLRIGIIDLVAKGPTRAMFARVMNANLASIMPQVLGVWCEQEGHDVTFVCYTGFENLVKETRKPAILGRQGGLELRSVRNHPKQVLLTFKSGFHMMRAVTLDWEYSGPEGHRISMPIEGLSTYRRP